MLELSISPLHLPCISRVSPGIQEAWDGPALLTFCDGKQIGAQLDRNGLRPARVLLTNDGLLAMMSETGVVDVKDEDVLWKGRLGPGLQITMDLETGEIRKNVEVTSANPQPLTSPLTPTSPLRPQP